MLGCPYYVNPPPAPGIIIPDRPMPITFRHPGYRAPLDNILFTMPRVDYIDEYPGSSMSSAMLVGDDDDDRPRQPSHPHRMTRTWGVTHGIALLACQIIANNDFRGFLATDRDGQYPVRQGRNGLLTEDSYWFISSRRADELADQDVGGQVDDKKDEPYVYPIVPAFEQWQFPHDHFEAVYTLLQYPQTAPVLPSDTNEDRCVLSNASWGCKTAHMIQRAHTGWYHANGMERYRQRHNERNGQGNGIIMRLDLHAMWNELNFVLMPKKRGLRVHVLAVPDGDGNNEFATQWHDRLLLAHGTNKIGDAFLFARFAQAVFKLLKPFVVDTMRARRVARLLPRADAQPDAQEPRYEVVEQWLGRDELRALYNKDGEDSNGNDGGETSAGGEGSYEIGSSSRALAEDLDQPDDFLHPRQTTS